jgi:hypothetical protein
MKEDVVMSIILLGLSACPTVCRAEDNVNSAMAQSAMQFGGTTGRLMWQVVESPTSGNAPPNSYLSLAEKVKSQIDLGRATSSLIKQPFNTIATISAYSASKAPDPLDAGILGVVAWASKKTGDYLESLVGDHVEKEALQILANGLPHLSVEAYKSLSTEELKNQLADLEIGGQQLRVILEDYPKALGMVQASAADNVANISVEALEEARAAQEDVGQIRKTLSEDWEQITNYQTAMGTRMHAVESGLDDLQGTADQSRQKLDDLETSVEGQAEASAAIAGLSYPGLTTEQKLEAVEAGSITGLQPNQSEKLKDSLRADLAQELSLKAVQSMASDLGDITKIASNLGVPRDAVQGLSAAQTTMAAMAQFGTGNYLGAVASLTSLVGLGAPDAAEQRHAQLMGYLRDQFAEVNSRLNTIIGLQKKTLNVLSVLVEEQRSFRDEVLSQLDRIENEVLLDGQILRAIIKSQWEDCDALANGVTGVNGNQNANGNLTLRDREMLLDILSHRNNDSYMSACYSKLSSFIDANVTEANWSGTVIAADVFPSQKIAIDNDSQKKWNAAEKLKLSAFASARKLLELAAKSKISDDFRVPVALAARIGQPVISVEDADDLKATLLKGDTKRRFEVFHCPDGDVLAPPMHDLMCFGPLTDGSPDPKRLNNLLDSALIGPQAARVIDTGIVVAQLSNFAIWQGDSLTLIDRSDVENFPRGGISAKLQMADHTRAVDLLRKLQLLAEAMILHKVSRTGTTRQV